MKEAGLVGVEVGRDGVTLIAGFLLKIGFFWSTPSGGGGVGISSTRISGGALGTIESDIGPLAGISCARIAATWVEGFAGIRLDEAFGGDNGTEAGLGAGLGGMFALWEGEPQSDWGDVAILPNAVFP